MRADLAFGQSVENLAAGKVLPRLFPNGITQDVSNKKYWRRHGVDFIVHDEVMQDKLLLEVKADRQDTGNIVLEKFTDDRAGVRHLGWLYTSKADFLLYFILKRRKLLVLDMAKLRFDIEHAARKPVVKSTWSNWGTTYFYIMPVKTLEAKYTSVVFREEDWEQWMNEFKVVLP